MWGGAQGGGASLIFQNIKFIYWFSIQKTLMSEYQSYPEFECSTVSPEMFLGCKSLSDNLICSENFSSECNKLNPICHCFKYEG